MGKSNSGGEILIKSNPIGNAETKKHEIAAKSGLSILGLLKYFTTKSLKLVN